MDAITETIEGRPSIQAKPRQRLDWLDAAKGIGIILVVTGHSIGGVMALPLPGKNAILSYGYAAIYTFHMDLFFFLSGLTIASRVQKNPDDFLKKNFTKIAYSYLLWSFIQYNILYFIVGKLANNPIDGYSFMIFLTGSVAQFWFLYVLFFYNLISRFLLYPLGPIALVLAAIAMRPFAPLVDAYGNLGHFCQFAFPYMLGVALRSDRLDGWLTRLGIWPIVALLAFVIVDEALILSPVYGGLPVGYDGQKMIDFVYAMPVLPSSLILSATAIGLAANAARPLQARLAYLGRMSLPIYILHVMCIAGLRIVLDKFLHVANIWPILIIIVPCGVAIPLVAVAILDRLRLARPLGLL